VPRTAFCSRQGVHEPTVMPFGLASGPATMRAWLKRIFAGFDDQLVVVYLDDILTRTAEHEPCHMTHPVRELSCARGGRAVSRAKLRRTSPPGLPSVLGWNGKTTTKEKPARGWPTMSNSCCCSCDVHGRTHHARCFWQV